MRVLQTRSFAKFARKAGVSSEQLLDVVIRLSDGRADADLGGGVYKQRIARRGAGKSGGFRTIILFQFDSVAVFVEGFAKSDKTNISADELLAYKLIARDIFANTRYLSDAIISGALLEVKDADKEI